MFKGDFCSYVLRQVHSFSFDLFEKEKKNISTSSKNVKTHKRENHYLFSFTLIYSCLFGSESTDKPRIKCKLKKCYSFCLCISYFSLSSTKNINEKKINISTVPQFALVNIFLFICQRNVDKAVIKILLS